MLACFTISVPSYTLDGQSEICPGCEDLTPTPDPPPIDTYSSFGDDWFYVTYAVMVSNDSGICIIEELEIPGAPAIEVCDQAVPCTPKITLTADIDDDTI